MNFEPAAGNTPMHEQARMASNSTALAAIVATTCVGLAAVLVLSLRGGSCSVSTPTTAVTVAVNPPRRRRSEM